jgi:hypothetical protein
MVAANPRGRGRAMKEMKEKGNGEMEGMLCVTRHFQFFQWPHDVFSSSYCTSLVLGLLGLRAQVWAMYTLYCLATHAIWQCHPALALCFIVLAVFVCIYIYIIINPW